MQLGYFTEEAYERLLGDIDINRDKYAGEEEWIDAYFGNNEYFKISSVEVNKFNPYYGDDVRSEDLTNSRNLYEAFKNLTPLQASNKYMWTYLCHKDKDCRKYIQQRWKGSNIDQRYFVVNDGDGLYYFNSLSRLWWCAYFTYDKENKRDPYALTKILYDNQMVLRDFLGTINKSNFTRTKGMLLALSEFKNDLKQGEGINQYYRECNKILNHYAAVNALDFMEFDEIKELVYGTLKQVRDRQTKLKK